MDTAHQLLPSDRTRKRAAIPVLPLVSILVVTPREQIVGLCRDLAALVDEGDAAAIGRYLASDFEAGRLDRLEFLKRVERTLGWYHVDNVRLHRFDVVFPREEEGVAVFDSACRVRSADASLDRLTARRRVTFLSRGGLRSSKRFQHRFLRSAVYTTAFVDRYRKSLDPDHV